MDPKLVVLWMCRSVDVVDEVEMSKCPYAEKCPFFNDAMAKLPLSAEMYKERYCKGDFNKCARFEVRSKCGKEAVPANLYPNQKDRAAEIVKSSKK